MAITKKLRDIADAIREKTGSTELMRIDQMDDIIKTLDQVSLPDYEGDYVVVPSFDTIVLDTDEKSTREDIVIQPIQVNEVSNTSDGKTLII